MRISIHLAREDPKRHTERTTVPLSGSSNVTRPAQQFVESAILVEPDAAAAAELAARLIASSLRASLMARPTATLGVSGGSTPRNMFLALSNLSVEWNRVHVIQVDERLVPPDHPDRNLGALRRDLLDRIPEPASFLPLPVDGDLERGATRLGDVLIENRFDVMHLGLGADGHSASLFADDPDLGNGPLVETPEHGGHRRVSLAEPVLANTRIRVVLCTGAAKGPALESVRLGDTTAVLSLMSGGTTIVVADSDAASSHRATN